MTHDGCGRSAGEAITLMTFTKARFTSFEAYLTAEVSDLPEGRCEYWDGKSRSSESLGRAFQT